MKNPFLSRGTSPKSAEKLALAAVHHSFWSSMQARGWPASDAAHAAWALIRATRPAMKGSREARVQIASLELTALDDLMVMVARARVSPRMTDEARQELLADVESMVRGYIDARSAPVPDDVMVAGAARNAAIQHLYAEHPSPTQEQIDAVRASTPFPGDS